MGKYEKEIRLIPFLADISPALADEAERWICVYQYTAGETVRAPDGGCGILLMTDGRAAVYSADSDRDVLLRVLGRGGITGVANLFSDAPLASRIVALTGCTVLFLPESALRTLFASDSSIMYGYIAFLSERIRFLNRKIVTLTAGSAERRLAVFLDTIAPEDGGTFVIPISMSALAGYLDLGRASLYRAFDTLCADGFVMREGKTIRLLHREGMTAFYL